MLVSLPSPFSIPYLATNFNKFAFVIFSWGVVGEGRGGDAEATNFNKFTFLIFSWGGGGEGGRDWVWLREGRRCGVIFEFKPNFNQINLRGVAYPDSQQQQQHELSSLH
jgi:hypothetical protein